MGTLLLGAALGGGASAEGPFGDQGDRLQDLEPPPSLPQSFNVIIRPPRPIARPGAQNAAPIETLRGIGEVIGTCWRRPEGSGYTGQEITHRVAFKRSGEVLGQPRITYYKPAGGPEQRESFARSVREAFVRCSPLRFSEKLGAAVAGRLFTFRFVDEQTL
jgi:hypothetical protein